MRIMHLSRMASMFSNFVHPVILEQKRRGHYVCVCTAEEPEAQKLRDMGIEVFAHDMKRSINPVNVIRTIGKIKQILFEKEIDVLICHNNIASGMGRIAAWLAKTKYAINFCHGFSCLPVQNQITWHLQFFIERILGLITHAMIVMNDYDENLCRTRKIIKNPNMVLRVPGMGVNLEKFSVEGSEQAKQKIAKELNFNQKDVIVLSVSRLMPNKGVFVLLEAARKICAKRSDVRFVVAGVGRSRKKLEKIIKKNHLEDKFKLLGWRNDVYVLIKASDIFVLPTFSSEGLPVSILEAMSCGKPVVATRYRGCQETVVARKTGLLVPVKQVKPLVQAIKILINRPLYAKKLGESGRKRVEEHFELNYCTNKIADALDKAMS